MRTRQGFTLVELIVVIAIITLLMSLLVVFIPGIVERARYRNAEARVQSLARACAAYKLDFGAYPPSAEGTKGLRRSLGSERRVAAQKGAAGGVEILKPPLVEFPVSWLGEHGTIVDPWGGDLRYQAPGRRNPGGVDLWSAGPNGRDELDPAHPDFDDITTWTFP